MKSLRVLLVDDDSDGRGAIMRALGQSQHVAKECRDADDALAHLRSADYDVLLTDLVMPGISGLELIAVARRDRPDLRCIVMSGHERVAEADAHVVWLTKPIQLDSLFDALEA